MISFTSNKSNFYLHQQHSVALKYAKNALATGALPRTPLGSSQHSPHPVVGWGGGPLQRPHPLGASILAPAALVFQPKQYHFLKRSGAHADTTGWLIPRIHYIACKNCATYHQRFPSERSGGRKRGERNRLTHIRLENDS